MSHPGELLPNPGTMDFSPMSHKVRVRVTTRLLCRVCLHLISNAVYLASGGFGSCLSELVVVCTYQSQSRDMRALDSSSASQQYARGMWDWMFSICVSGSSIGQPSFSNFGVKAATEFHYVFLGKNIGNDRPCLTFSSLSSLATVKNWSTFKPSVIWLLYQCEFHPHQQYSCKLPHILPCPQVGQQNQFTLPPIYCGRRGVFWCFHPNLQHKEEKVSFNHPI